MNDRLDPNCITVANGRVPLFSLLLLDLEFAQLRGSFSGQISGDHPTTLQLYAGDTSYPTCVDSELRPIDARVTMGSDVGAMLYLIFINGLPTIPRVTLSLYA
ncbi:hypothetical protein J6590_093748 [Homalodisca vitripennis]|nr:hypothetical protein J6590_078444 [Homalodisca vitripennis]KAG8300276.1 hypothetical protein J6590_079917 [Homalodisca vitripennis]KAG8309114.1 hypothetical protein J6590_093748 [Homalodisca vitripennis]